jgi:hypothetical protein
MRLSLSMRDNRSERLHRAANRAIAGSLTSRYVARRSTTTPRPGTIGSAAWRTPRRKALTDTDWKKEMLEIREMCQTLEDALKDNGWDEISIRTKHGKVTWRTDDRAAQIEEDEEEIEEAREE